MAGKSKGVLLICAGMLVGAAIGAYGTKVVYGENPRPTATAACPSCPACVAQTDEQPTDVEVFGTEPELPNAGSPPPPGLPVSALERAGRAVDGAIGACWSGIDRGTAVVLDLTVTATSGQGWFRAVRAVKAPECDGGRCPAVECIETASRQATFAWEGADGETHLVWPLVAP
ncbi:MAG: hypothetical protein HY791_09205 [Deltaproteobacteria bacterium]|nr:hypothetical protein [Deltaproteobacteria bacterium]